MRKESSQSVMGPSRNGLPPRVGFLTSRPPLRETLYCNDDLDSPLVQGLPDTRVRGGVG